MCVNYPRYNPAIGISKKIKSQIETFRKIGYAVTYSAYENDSIVIYGNHDNIEKKYPYPTQSCLGLTRRFYLMHACKNYLMSHDFDLAFVRWDALDVSFFSVLKQMKKCCNNILMDFHGYFPNMKPVKLKTHYAFWTTQLFGNYLKNYVTYGIGETKCGQLFGINIMTIDTGINVDDYKPHCYLGNTHELHMISVANETVYHGYDRIIDGLNNYYKSNPSVEVHLHLVGKLNKNSINRIHEVNLPDKIHLYGYKSGNELMEIYNQCNMGVGPLAPHRIGGKEGTGIKTKEYFALGLPYFYAGSELLVPEDYKYAYKIQANNDPIDLHKILSFWQTIKDDSEIRANMRTFAREHFSWLKIFNDVLSQINQVK